MSVLEVRIMGDPVLRQKAEPLADISDETRRLIKDMFDTMYEKDGVGLAANQVGVAQRVIVVDPRATDMKPLGIVNPVIVAAADEVDRGEEGCLSIPGLKDIVERAASVIVEGMDADGKPLRIEADGLLARVLQHEVDHLDGVLFVDRVSPLKRKLLLKRWQKVKP